jgi:hypothetical protein
VQEQHIDAYGGIKAGEQKAVVILRKSKSSSYSAGEQRAVVIRPVVRLKLAKVKGKESNDSDQIRRFRANYGLLILGKTSHKVQARTS